MRTLTPALPKVRYITPASIEIGDTVRVTWKVGDIEHSRVAKIAKRDYEGSMRVFFTRDGSELFRWHPAYNKEYTVTLLDRKPATQETLPGF
jgi:hypothetical protein